jgi:uncharacterized damage-inducible protein DinB
MPDIIKAVAIEFHRIKTMVEKALDQIDDKQLNQRAAVGNSIATICWHMAGNLHSRFTDFLTTDGEKPWRDRESEFAERKHTRAELNVKWEQGWSALFATLATLSDSQRGVAVRIRHQPLSVEEALLRALGHICIHAGQVIDRAHMLKGNDWTYLTIPPGESDAVNARAPKPGDTSTAR